MGQLKLIQVEPLSLPSPLQSPLVARLVDEYSTHGLGRGGEEVAARVPVLDLLGIRHHFGRIVDVRDLEYESKPQPAAYERVCELLGVLPEECLMVEDNARNLMPARELGMITVLVQDGSGATDSETFTVWVNNTNGAPNITTVLPATVYVNESELYNTIFDADDNDTIHGDEQIDGKFVLEISRIELQCDRNGHVTEHFESNAFGQDALHAEAAVPDLLELANGFRQIERDLPTRHETLNLKTGDRLDLPSGIRHSAVVGPEGVTCLEAHIY